MNWHIITFDHKELPPDGSVQKTFLGYVQKVYFTQGEPKGFALFHSLRPDFVDEFFLSPVPVIFCQDLIAFHSGAAWNESLPDDAVLMLGDGSVRS